MGGKSIGKLSVGILVFVGIIGLGAATAFCQQKEIVVMTYGGVWGDSFKNNIADPFTKKTGIKVNMVTQLTNRDGFHPRDLPAWPGLGPHRRVHHLKEIRKSGDQEIEKGKRPTPPSHQDTKGNTPFVRKLTATRRKDGKTP